MEGTKVAVVTGGTRRIGLAIARALAAEGWALALPYLSDDDAAAAALAALRPVAPGVVTLRADVSSALGAQRVAREVGHVLGRVDLLVNNVGPFHPAPLLDTPLDAYETMVQGNLGSVFHMCQALLPLMRSQGSGCVINLGTQNVELARGAPNAALYHALKAAVVVLTRSLARSEGPHGIRVNMVNPGMVDTVGVGEAIVERIPLRRLATGEDVARAVVWLASAEASYVSGAILNVHGGLWA